MGTEKLKRVLGLVERIDTMATHLPQLTTSSADYIQDVESEDARDNLLEKKELVSKGNDIGATTRGEHNFNKLDFPTIHATVEQSIVKQFLNLSLSQDGCLDIPCDKEKLCDDAYVVLVPHLMTEIDIVVSKTTTCAENNIFIPITSVHDELKLLSSLNTLGYIEFDMLCNLNCLEDKLFACSKLTHLHNHTYYFIGRYNYNGQYMVHRVYICSDLKASFVAHQHGHIESYSNTNLIISSSSSLVFKKQAHFQNGEHCWLLNRTSSTPALKLRTVCFQEGENDEDMTRMYTNIIRTYLGRDMDDEYVICLCITIRAKDKVSLFLCYLFTYFENRLLPKNIIVIRNHGDDDGVLKDRHGGGEE
jgi:hypothetical protein